MTAPVVQSSASAEGATRPLTAADAPALRRLLDADPVTHCFVASRLEALGGRIGADLWGYFRGGDLVSALHVGANIIPVATDADSRIAFADRLLRTGRRGSSFVGPADEVLDLWGRVERRWGRPREVRSAQPLLVIDRDGEVAPDPLVRPALPHEIDVLVPACVAMFTEEVGISPISGGAAAAYRARIAELVHGRRALVRMEQGTVVFKAEIGALSSKACQVQGVWVTPNRRGEGLSVPGMSAVVHYARRSIAPMVSLYVNDYNHAARACYAAVGLRQVGEFATVLL
ncbi:MAG: GNAT family N-acetyltransferase [Candidatus Nanopelagicales bacterium]